MKLHYRLFILFTAVVLLFAAGLFVQRSIESKRIVQLFEMEKSGRASLCEKMINLKGKQLENFTVDYTYWDDMVTFVKTGNREWARQNIDESLPTYQIEAGWIYSKKFSLIYSFNSLKDMPLKEIPLPPGALPAIFAQNRLCHFFILLSEGLLEIRGASIHPTNDKYRKTEPQGYMLAANFWDHRFMSDITTFTDSRVAIVPIGEKEPFASDPEKGLISFLITLPAWNSRPVATINMLYESRVLKTYIAQFREILKTILYFSILMVAVLGFYIERWIMKPLSDISQALTDENPDIIAPLQKKKHEFGAIANLIAEFFRHKQALLEEIVSHRKTEAELVKAKDMSESANKAKSQFLATMSHEIRTPMNAIIGMTSLLKTGQLTGEQKELIDIITQSGENLLVIINDILDFSKIESGHMVLDQQPFSLHECIESVLTLFQHRAFEKNLELLYEIDESLPIVITGDRTRFHQILGNLVSNAIKFTDKGDVIIKASGDRISDTEKRIRVEIEDSGIGIPENQIALLFRSFSQVDASNTRRYGGTGLGLAICKRLIELMGGTIGVKSTPGQGSVFHIELTVRAAESAPSMFEKEKAVVAGKKIMVLQYHAKAGEILSKSLSSWGAVPLSMTTLFEARAALKEQGTPDLAILDNSDEFRGLCAALRSSAEKECCRIILLNSPTSIKRISDTNLYDAALNKPVKPHLLIRQIYHLYAREKVKDLSVEPAPAGVQKSHSSLTILIAEDNLVNQKVTTAMLTSLGYRADVAENGAEAIRKMTHRHYDVIIMDIQMPVMDGLQASYIIRSKWPHDEQPYIIALTAAAFKEDEDLCIKAGMDFYLSKPLKISKLKEVLQICSAPRQTGMEEHKDTITKEEEHGNQNC